MTAPASFLMDEEPPPAFIIFQPFLLLPDDCGVNTSETDKQRAIYTVISELIRL
jgi:hypothetical protein